jgi:hypothetical protein
LDCWLFPLPLVYSILPLTLVLRKQSPINLQKFKKN